jgi:hypothetical protein
MNFTLINNHLERAANCSNSFDKFDALWSAFNVMYEAKRTEYINVTSNRRPKENEIAKYCARHLPYIQWISLFPSRIMSNLFTIAPIVNVRDLLRNSQMNSQDFDRLLAINLTQNSGNPDTDNVKLDALVDLLYVVRCNKVHGFKTPDRNRDVEVLDNTVPLLEFIVTRLYVFFQDN